MPTDKPKIAFVIPCLDEESTIGKVIDDFRAELPDAEIIVINNNSSDNTEQVAVSHGARVLQEPRPGKGFVVETIFRLVSADVCVMVDGDDTYPADHVHDLIKPILANEADMVVGSRKMVGNSESFRPLHIFGNGLVIFI